MPRNLTAYRLVGTAVRELEGRVQISDRIDAFARDPWLHCDEGHVKTIDLETLEEVDFRPYDHQREIADAWIDLSPIAAGAKPVFRNVHDEKSRQMGETEAIAWLCLWAISYWPVTGLAMALKEKDVDDGGSGSTHDSFFGKVRFMWERLPDRYRPPLSFTYLAIRHGLRPTSYLAGTGATPDPGRGKHYDFGVVDEAARLPFGKAAQASLKMAIPHGRIYNSTPAGEDNEYARLGKTRPRDFRFLRHHWSSHPVYSRGLHVAAHVDRLEGGGRLVVADGDPDCRQCRGVLAGKRWTPADPAAHRYPGRVTSPWYEEAILELTDEQVATELDIDYSGSLPARVFPEFDEDVHVDVRVDGWQEGAAMPELAWDYGLDVTSVLLMQDFPSELRIFAEVEVEQNATPEAVVDELRDVLLAAGYPHANHLETTRTLFAAGDPAGEHRELTGRPIIADYYRLGFRIHSRPMRPGDVKKTILAAKRLMLGIPKPLRVSPDCRLFIEHAKNNKYPTDRYGARKPGVETPLDDRHNHMMRAFAYYVTYKWPPGTTDDSLRRATEATTEPEPSGTTPGLRQGMRL